MKAFLSIASLFVMACSVSTSDPIAFADESLSCPTPTASESHNPWWKTQYDGTKCENTNCGLASVAMLRNALTCGTSDHTGGYMRARLNELPQAGLACDGTDPNQWAALLEYDAGGHWIDGTTKLDVVLHRADGFTIDDLAEKMSHGWKAAVPGNASNGQTAPCGYAHDHALFIGNWDGAKFDVYDPDSHNDPGSAVGSNCGSDRTGHAVVRWTKDELRRWASGFRGSSSSDLWLVIARLPQ